MEPIAGTSEGSPAEPVPRPGKRLVVACWVYALAVVSAWVLLRYAGDRWWPATVLLYAPRWPWLLPLLILLPLSTRRRRLAWLPLLTGLFVLGPLMDLNIPWRRPAAPAAGQPLRVLTCNLHKFELNRSALDRYIEAERPDVIAFQDYTGWDDSPVMMRPGWHTYRLGQIFLASRYRIRRVHDLQLESIAGDDDRAILHRAGSAVCFDLQTPAGLLHFVNLHLASPHPGLRELPVDPEEGIFLLETNQARRRKESESIARWLATQSGPFVLAGDFNTVAESSIYREYWARYPDAFPTAGFGYGYTHLSLLSELRIDHLLTGPGVTCTGVRIGPPCGTPHRPLVANLVIR